MIRLRAEPIYTSGTVMLLVGYGMLTLLGLTFVIPGYMFGVLLGTFLEFRIMGRWF